MDEVRNEENNIKGTTGDEMKYTAKDTIMALIDNRDWASLRKHIARRPVAEIADFLSELGKPDRVLLFRVLPRNVATEVFSYLETSEQDELLKELTDEETRHIIANLAPDDRTELLEELPAQVTTRLLDLLRPEDSKEAMWLLGYPEKSIGRLMTPDYVAVLPNWTVRQALEHVRRWGRDSETVNMVYVKDDKGTLIGAVSLRQLVLDSPDTQVKDIMRTSTVSVRALDDRLRASEIMERYGLWVLPVTDSQGALVGIVTGDDVFELVREEITEDFHKGAGVAPIRVSLKDAGPLLLYKNRVGWLLGLVIVYLLSGRLMASFEDTIARAVSLVFFLPLIIDSAGNAGSQSAILMVRAIGVGDVTARDWAEVLLRELGVSAILGAIMGLTVLTVGAVSVGLDVGVVVGLTMLITVVMTCLLGAMIPFLLNKLGWDPASASSPLVTSIADILGVITYFFTARWYLGI
ncbi:MAG: magnesium transporter [Bacillota bacterium]